MTDKAFSKFKKGDEVSYSYGITYRHGRIIEVRYDSKTERYEYYICAHLPACYGSKATDIEYVWKKEEELTLAEKLRIPMYNVGDKVLYSLSGNALMAGTIKEIKPTENDILYKISYSDNVDAMWVSEENIQGLNKAPTSKYHINEMVVYTSPETRDMMYGTITSIKNDIKDDIIRGIIYGIRTQDALKGEITEWVDENSIHSLYFHDSIGELKSEDIEKFEHDNVSHPSHYETGKFECIEVMEEAIGKEAVMNFCICNAFKYIYRHKRKNGIEDIKKARWYLNKYIELDGSEDEEDSKSEKPSTDKFKFKVGDKVRLAGTSYDNDTTSYGVILECLPEYYSIEWKDTGYVGQYVESNLVLYSEDSQ